MRIAAVLALGLALTACASQEAQLVPPQPIMCTSNADCRAKWARAVSWINANSTYKIQTLTDTVIQTTGPQGADPIPAFAVTKVARGEGRYEITFNGDCGNRLRCEPTIAESRARFTEFVLAQGPSPQSATR
jgi:hypothetical protein